MVQAHLRLGLEVNEANGEGHLHAALGERSIEGEVKDRAFLNVDAEFKFGFHVVASLRECCGQAAHKGADEDEDEKGAHDDEGEGGADQARQELLTEVHVRWL